MPPRGPLIFLTAALIAMIPFLIAVAYPFLISFILASILAIVMNRAGVARASDSWPGLASFLPPLRPVLVVGVVIAFASFAITRELSTVS